VKAGRRVSFQEGAKGVNMNKKIEILIKEVKKVIKGKDDKIRLVVTAILANGNILLEDNPGLGKTVLAKTLSQVMQIDQKRIQFTPDTMPTDITGYSVMEKVGGEYQRRFQAGPVFTNILLADEINRTSGKTQAALLESMEEKRVTVDGENLELPDPFVVIATQNPNTSVGTQQLPDAQLDRFLIKLSMDYPDIDSEVEMLREMTGGAQGQMKAVMTGDEIIRMKEAVKNIYVDEKIAQYIVKISNYTRSIEDKVAVGISPRGSKAILNMAKANAFVEGREFVNVEDVQTVIESVVPHRLILTPSFRREENGIRQILDEILREVPAPVISGFRHEYSA